jgi:hypothetical protein
MSCPDCTDDFTRALRLDAAPEIGGSGVRVVVVGDVSHVVIRFPLVAAEFLISHDTESLEQLRLYVRRWRGIVHSPHHHRHEADFTITNPTQFVVVVPLGYDRRVTKLALIYH